MLERLPEIDLTLAERWIREVVEPAGPLELERHRPWASVYRVPVANGSAWFKACRPVQGFEPALAATLAARWPDRVSQVLAHDPGRGWLLTADAGKPIGEHGNDPGLWLQALPRYGELQRGESSRIAEHLGLGVPDRRPATLADRFVDLLRRDLPISHEEASRLRGFEGPFRKLCRELDEAHAIASIQHDDLHLRSLFVDGRTLRVLDWGDASVAHPFASLVATFRFLEKEPGLAPEDPWFERLRDAYLEPWGGGLADVFALAMRVGLVAHAIGWLAHRDVMVEADRVAFDVPFAELLRRVLTRAVEPAS